MDRELYHDHHHLEESHWWFLGRRYIVEDFLKNFLEFGDRILDVGSGGGGMLEVLLRYGSVTAMEGDTESVERIRVRYGDRVAIIPSFLEQSQLSLKSFNVVTMFDVLEHIDDDDEALRIIHNILPDNGIFIATLPACPFLWSGHDELNQHYRRYVRRDLCRRLQAAGFTIERISYFNFFLFFPTLLIRIVFRCIGRVGIDTRVSNGGMNSFLARLFSFERFFLRNRNFPIGVSLIVVARKSV